MIDAAALPILTRAIDFLFDEFKKILEERRNRRQNADQNKKHDRDIKTDNNPIPSKIDEKIIVNRRDAMGATVDESVWREMGSEITHLLEILEIQKKNYHLHMKQFAYYGEADVPQRVIHSLDNDEQGIIETSKKLQQALSKVYKAKISVLEEDESID